MTGTAAVADGESQATGADRKPARVTHHTERVAFPKDGKKAKAYFQELQRQYDRRWCVNRVRDAYQSELEFYRERYSGMAEARNQTYAKTRHAERMVTIESLHGGRNTCPEELSVRAGTESREAFEGCLMGYLSWMRQWSRENGGHLHVLGAYIAKEGPCRAIIRRVWDCPGKDGLPRLSMAGALKESGVPLPDDGEGESRYNNRKMTFDRMSREALYQGFEEAGIPVNREPGVYTLRQALKIKEEADAAERDARDVLCQIMKTEEKAAHLDGTEGVLEDVGGGILVPEQGYLLLKIREGLGGAMAARLKGAERKLLDALEEETEAGRLRAMQEGIRKELELEYAVLRAGLLRCGYYAGG